MYNTPQAKACGVLYFGIMEQNNEGVDISKEEALLSGAPEVVPGFEDTLMNIDERIKKGRREMGFPVDEENRSIEE